MSQLFVVVGGSSSSLGTNLSSPTTQRYAALLQTWLRANRQGLAKGHCRVSVVAFAGIGTYEQQVTGFTIPGNRSAVVSVNTSNNITAMCAVRPKPDVLIYHQTAGNMPEAQANWGCVTVQDFQDFVDNENGPLTGNIVTAAYGSGVKHVIVLGCHPVTAAAKTTNNWSSAQITGRHYLNHWYAAHAAQYGYQFIDYWNDVAVGTNYNDAAHEIAPAWDGVELTSKLIQADGVHMNATYLSSVFTPNRLQTAGLDTVLQWHNLLDIVP
jgi:hypothetical protein